MWYSSSKILRLRNDEVLKLEEIFYRVVNETIVGVLSLEEWKGVEPKVWMRRVLEKMKIKVTPIWTSY
jgi:hypothetical protein